MRTTVITISGKDYPVAINLGLVAKIEEQGQTLESVLNQIDKAAVGETVKMLAGMMQAAKEYDEYLRSKGMEPVCQEDFVPLTEEEILMEFDFRAYADDLYGKVQAAIIELIKPAVEVKPAKKGKGATQAG